MEYTVHVNLVSVYSECVLSCEWPCDYHMYTLVDVHVYTVMDVGTDVHESCQSTHLVSFEMRWNPNVLTAMLTGRCALRPSLTC